MQSSAATATATATATPFYNTYNACNNDTATTSSTCTTCTSKKNTARIHFVLGGKILDRTFPAILTKANAASSSVTATAQSAK